MRSCSYMLFEYTRTHTVHAHIPTVKCTKREIIQEWFELHAYHRVESSSVSLLHMSLYMYVILYICNIKAGFKPFLLPFMYACALHMNTAKLLYYMYIYAVFVYIYIYTARWQRFWVPGPSTLCIFIALLKFLLHMQCKAIIYCPALSSSREKFLGKFEFQNLFYIQHIHICIVYMFILHSACIKISIQYQKIHICVCIHVGPNVLLWHSRD